MTRKFDQEENEDLLPIVNLKGENIQLANILIIKILDYRLKSLSHNELYDFVNSIQIVCKSWNLFIVNKLNLGKYLTKCNDYFKIFNNISNLIEGLGRNRGYVLTNSNIGQYQQCIPISKLLSLLITKPIEYESYSKSKFGSKRSQILIDNISCGDENSPNYNLILKLSTPYNNNNQQQQQLPNEINKNRINDYHKEPIYKPLKSFSDHYKIEFDKILIYQEGVEYDVNHLKERNENQINNFQIGVLLLPIWGGKREDNEYNNNNNKLKLLFNNNFSHEIYHSNYSNWIFFLNESISKINPVEKGVVFISKFNVFINPTIYTGYCEENFNPSISEIEFSQGIKSIDYYNYYKYLNEENEENNIYNNIKRYNYSIIKDISNRIKDDLKLYNVGLILKNSYSSTNTTTTELESSGSGKELKGIDLTIWNALKEIYDIKRLSISTFIIESFIPPKIEILNHRTVHFGSKSSSNCHTIFYACENYMEDLKIFQDKSDNYESSIKMFSAILISKN
ncbi:hypothetical protein DDB_G0278939 [Dictyostelium discoideum AX4]|uniref:Uncharacterized protein n=1 Tax=Dictyostelium discoideum TaxID=44689 RepID=Q54XQ1_DICDI|nr:hypothetical protein DDB_G0278939 [Dictyostelium discoideum AX4]EAL68071.1 hypothetical protein DDB_G0278939 [Dictyostelium discoideum AX4]|eukprot:XP_641979.1 hypothetical protein DDB_G0278939 [Dictyostelium discoideum AX4]